METRSTFLGLPEVTLERRAKTHSVFGIQAKIKRSRTMDGLLAWMPLLSLRASKNKYTFEKELRLRQTLGLNKFCFSVGFHLTFAATELGFFSAGHVPVGTRDRRSSPMVSTQ